MRGQGPLFSSDSANWRTPPALLTSISTWDLGGYLFDFDFAADAKSTVARHYFGPDNPFPEYRSLWRPDKPTVSPQFPTTLPLRGYGWLNPPFRHGNKARDILPIKIEWSLARAVELSQGKNYSWTIYALVPARTDTRWWWTLVWPFAAEVRLIPGRLRFLDPVTDLPRAGAPFPSAVVIYRPGYAGHPMVRRWDFR
jgi:site-specific DNA-methyltransferase (adenine-specific)